MRKIAIDRYIAGLQLDNPPSITNWLGRVVQPYHPGQLGLQGRCSVVNPNTFETLTQEQSS